MRRRCGKDAPLHRKKKDAPRVYEEIDRWEVVVTVNPNEKFSHVSFVNGISTNEGG